MKERVIRTIAAVLATAGVMLSGLPGLAIGADVSPAAPEAEGEAGEVVSAYLDYHEVGFSFNDVSLAVSTRNEAFTKEPAWGGGKVVRGTLGGASNDMSFAWDRSAGKLYLDLNRNLDLTDDPGGVFSDQAGTRGFSQTFTNVHLPWKVSGVSRPMLMDLKFYYRNVPHCSVQMRSFWQGKVVLQGEEWQVGLVEGRYLAQYASPGGTSLLLRPWAERNQRFSCLFNNDSLADLPLTEKVFFGGRGYRLQCTNEVQGESGRFRMQFAELKPKLGELRIAGEFLQRVRLESGPYLVVLDRPGAVVKVPVGHYGSTKVRLKKGETEAYPARTSAGAEVMTARLTISEKVPAVLRAGGPLTNTVSISGRGRALLFSYKLVGVEGAYQVADQDRAHPPEFAVYRGDKKVASGKFEFG